MRLFYLGGIYSMYAGRPAPNNTGKRMHQVVYENFYFLAHRLRKV